MLAGKTITLVGGVEDRLCLTFRCLGTYTNVLEVLKTPPEARVAISNVIL